MNNNIFNDLQATPFTSPLGEKLVILPLKQFEALLAASETEVNLDDILALIGSIDMAQENLPNSALPFYLKQQEGFHRLKSIRKARFLKQADLALLAAVSQSLISSLENKTNEGTVETWIKLADALDVSLDFLLR